MQKTSFVTALSVAVVFGLAGWYVGTKANALGHEHKAKDCRGSDCDVTIKFDCGLFSCEPYAVEEVILVTHGKKITFTIESSKDYKFDDSDGIKFASNKFTCSSSGAKKFKCDVADDISPNVYKYSIYVQGLTKVDPWAVAY